LNKKKKTKNKVQTQNIMAFLYYVQDNHNKQSRTRLGLILFH